MVKFMITLVLILIGPQILDMIYWARSLWWYDILDQPMREKYPNTEFFWSVFPCIRIRKNSLFEHFSRSSKNLHVFCFWSYLLVTVSFCLLSVETISDWLYQSFEAGKRLITKLSINFGTPNLSCSREGPKVWIWYNILRYICEW